MLRALARRKSKQTYHASLIGRKVVANSRRGTIRFMGTTHFAPGVWVGLELESRSGNHDGTFQGRKYFECPSERGIFVRESALTLPPRPPTPPYQGDPVPPSLVRSDSASRAQALLRLPLLATPTAARPDASALSPSFCITSPNPSSTSSAPHSTFVAQEILEWPTFSSSSSSSSSSPSPLTALSTTLTEVGSTLTPPSTPLAPKTWVWIVYCWVIQHISFDEQTFLSHSPDNLSPTPTPDEIQDQARETLASRKATPLGFASLIKVLVESVAPSISVSILFGHCKQYGFEAGGSFIDTSPDHYWNTIELPTSSESFALDATWGSAARARLRTRSHPSPPTALFYFAIPPSSLSQTHLPVPASGPEYESSVEAFDVTLFSTPLLSLYGLIPPPNQTCVLTPTSLSFSFELAFDPSTGLSGFDIALSGKLSLHGAYRMLALGDSMVDVFTESSWVLVQSPSFQTWTISVRLPSKNHEYMLELYGRDLASKAPFKQDMSSRILQYKIKPQIPSSSSSSASASALTRTLSSSSSGRHLAQAQPRLQQLGPSMCGFPKLALTRMAPGCVLYAPQTEYLATRTAIKFSIRLPYASKMEILGKGFIHVLKRSIRESSEIRSGNVAQLEAMQMASSSAPPPASPRPSKGALGPRARRARLGPTLSPRRPRNELDLHTPSKFMILPPNQLASSLDTNSVPDEAFALFTGKYEFTSPGFITLVATNLVGKRITVFRFKVLDA